MGRKKDVRRRAVLIVDDHPIVRQGLSQLIGQQPDLFVCGESDGGGEALVLAATRKPDAVIVDISLRDMSGLEVVRDLHRRWPRLPILVFSMHSETLYAERALRAGASGYVSKVESAEKVLTALRQILSGEVFVAEKVAGRLLRKISGLPSATASTLDRLSDRELEVFDLLGRGNTTREIAERFHRSVKTVETYRAHLKEKLGLQNASELIQHAVQWVHDGRMN